MRNRETLKKLFTSGDYYWVGCADNTLNSYAPESVPVFFILYDAGYPVQIIEYRYYVSDNILKHRKDWG